ncbi:serine/threonine protein kinase [Streptomyces acidiscabies]|uniref:non-specific serine/threonine protein kinase n=1 Tax=Streptomyces acidiscabies TaxID=42234 RepID=A0A0L0KJA6_9ACTN|nr:serine/threonine protein kinase [Streptomyces acidiscabies]KND38347.1 serine/threonine protein phosphatase [Streptomyces acidiscabies]
MSDEGRLIAGRYRVLDRIGRGGMATVWRARDESLARVVAVKQLHPQPHLDESELATLYERTRREARSAARISHPNVVVVHDVVDDEGRPVIVMEYVPSVTLAELVAAKGPLAPSEAARIGVGVLAALRAAHGAGVLHRDVKPANVLLTEGGRVVLTDFGIAQAVETPGLTRTGQLVGSVDFMAPERLVGAAPGPEADLWALGATLFQAVDGRSPFLRRSVTETMYAIAMEPPPEVRDAGGLTPLIRGLLAPKPEDRLSGEEAERLLSAAMEDRTPVASASAPTQVPPDPGPPQLNVTTGLGAPRKDRSRRRTLLLAVTAVVVALATAALVLTLAQDPENATADPLPGGGTTPAPSSSPAPSSPSPTVSSSDSPTPSRAPSATPSPSTTGGQQDSAPENKATAPAPSVGSPSPSTPGRTLVVAASGKCLSSGAGTEGLQLFQSACDGSASQRWQFTEGTARAAGKCMTVAGGSSEDRTEIQLSTCTGSASQRFRLTGTQLVAAESAKCVDIFGGASGTGAVLWECNGRDNQTWTAS